MLSLVLAILFLVFWAVSAILLGIDMVLYWKEDNLMKKEGDKNNAFIYLATFFLLLLVSPFVILYYAARFMREYR